MADGELPEYVREFAEYKDCERFALDFVQKYPKADYRRILLIRRTTSDNFGIKEYHYIGHSWIEYNGKLLMAYSGFDTFDSYTVGEHFKRNKLTPDQLHDKIIKFKQYCVDVTREMQSKNLVPTDFIKNVELYQRNMFLVGVSEYDKEKLAFDFTLAPHSTFTFELKVFDIKRNEVELAPVENQPDMGGKKRTKRRRRTKRKLTKRRKTRKGKKGKRRRTKIKRPTKQDQQKEEDK